MKGFSRALPLILALFSATGLLAQDSIGTSAPDTTPIATAIHAEGAHDGAAHDSAAHESKPFDPAPLVMGHIGDAHEFHIWGHISLPLPCIVYDKAEGLSFFLSSDFHHGEHAVHGFATYHGVLHKIIDFPTKESVALDPQPGDHGDHASFVHVVTDDKGNDHKSIIYQGKTYNLEPASKIFAGTSWVDFSMTKNVFTMLLASLLLLLAFFGMKRYYAANPGKAPRGITNLLEPLFEFMRDEVVKPSIGPNWERYMGLLMTFFFFILTCNLLGLIPFFPGSGNVMGNISVTIVLAVITFLVVNLSGNKHYWAHIFWMPNVPTPIKILFIPIELAGLIIKPFTLLIRLFANITAGHTIILTLVCLIFIFGNAGASVTGASVGAVMAFVFVSFMNLLELLVAFLQAFIFTLLSALYIGSAVEEHHHDEAHH